MGWAPWHTQHVALEAGVVRWEVEHRSEEDVTGLLRHTATRHGEIVVVRDDVVVQRIPVEPGARLLMTDGQVCEPGMTLAIVEPDQQFRDVAAPRPDIAVTAAQWADSEEVHGMPGERLGRLLKLLGDNPAVVSRTASQRGLEDLARITRRHRVVHDDAFFRGAGEQHPWASALAMQRCRFRFQRGLRAAAELWP